MALIAVAAAEGKTLPPGFRFHPTDEEIVGHYLRNKVLGRKPDIEVIREIDLYKCEPWDLPEKSILPTRDPEWYFFCARDKKYPNGSRSNRATEKGYWKATGKDRKVNSQSNKIGMKKTLVFYKGRAPHGERTDWLMHEYRLDEVLCKGSTQLQDLYVICRVFRKGRLVSKDGEQYGIPRDEIDLSLSKGTSSPSKVNSVGEIEEQSDERSLREIQDDDSPTTPGLPSETSSEILDSKAEDNVCLDGSVESSRGKSNLNCGVVSLDMTVVDKNAEDEVGNQGLLSIPSFNFDEVDNQELHLPQLPDFSFADDVIFGHMQMSDDDNLQYFFGYSIEDILAGEFSKQDDVPQPIEDPNNNEIFAADGNDGFPFNDVNVQFRPRPSTWQSHHQPLPSQGTAPRRIRLQCKDYDSEVVSEQEDSGLTSPSQTCSLEEDDVGSDIFSTGESSLGSEKSVNTTGLEEKSTLTEISDSMSSSECIESSCAHLGPLIANVLQDNNENLQQQFNNFDDSGEVIPVTREQAMLRKSKHVEKSDVTTSMSNVFERDMVLVKEGMESLSTMNSNRSSRASDDATGFDSMQVKASGSQGVTTHKTVIKCKESVKRTGFRFILCGLKQRGKSSTNDTVFVCEKESTDVIKRASYYSKEGGTGFVNLEKGGTGFVNLGKASSIFLVTGLLVTAVLVCFTWSYGS